MNKVKKYRVRRKLTQKQLAEKSGVDIQIIQRLEQGVNTTSVEKANDLAMALGVDKNGLFD